MIPLLLAACAALAVLVWPGPASPLPCARDAPSERLAEEEAATPHGVADALVLLSLALHSGMGQREALERVASCSGGAVAAQLRAVAAALRWGRPTGEAWAYAPRQWQPAALAWQVSEATGAGPAALLEEASWRIRDREDRRLEAAGARAAVRLVLPLGLAFLPAFAFTTVIPVVVALGRRVLGA